MFTIYFWRRLHCKTSMRWYEQAIEVETIDSGYCLDRYWIEKD